LPIPPRRTKNKSSVGEIITINNLL
jgi:hypothetical protein